MASASTATSETGIDPAQAQLVKEELERICADPLFRDTTRMKRFLRYVTEQTLEGRGGRLKGYVIGVEVFDRPDDFDPQADTIVRVQAGQLRRRLDLYYSERGQNSPVRILVPKGRYAPTFEMRQVTEPDETASPEALVRPVAPGADDPRPSIAVTTLDDLSVEEAGNPRFAEGLTAEIVNALVQFRAMRIVTLTPHVSTVLAGKSVRDIGAEIGADFVLSGSVRRDGAVFRVTFSLIRCETGEHLFSRVFDREYQPGSLFNMQEEIASYTAAAVAAPFGAVNRYNRRRLEVAGTTMEAYDCVLKYYDLRINPTRNAALKQLEAVEKVTEAHPEFSTGWAMRALLNTFLCMQSFPVADPDIHLTEADRTARRALSVDGQNALAYYALYQSYYHRGKFDDAGRMIRRALSLNPNDYSMLAYYAVCLAVRGKVERAEAMQTAALRLIGRAPPWFHTAQVILDLRVGDYEAAASSVSLDLTRPPALFELYGYAAMAYTGQADAVRTMLEPIVAAYPDYAAEACKAIELWHLTDDLATIIYEGLNRVGLDIACLRRPS